MQKILYGTLVLTGVGAPFTSWADNGNEAAELPQIVVTATKTETPLNEIGSVVTVISAEDIAAKNLTNVADALRTVPGLDVIRSGGPGQQTSVFMRGTNSNHTLVLIDGVEVNDPSSPNGGFDFAFLQTDNIERIEVLRGAASAVYGSDAIGGVINVITKKGRGAPKLTASAEGGTYNTWKSGAAVAGGNDRVNYSLDASRMETAGFPAADKNLGNTTPDAYRNTTVSGRTGLKVTDELDLGATLRYNDGKAFMDNCGGLNSLYGCDNPNAWNSFSQLFTRGFGHLKLFDNFWEQTLGLAYSRSQRSTSINNPLTSLDPYNYAGNNLGEKLKLDYQSVFHLHKISTLTMGVEEEADRLNFGYTSSYYGPPVSTVSIPVKTMNTVGYYLQDQLTLLERSFTTLGVRYDDNNRFGGHFTWRANELFAINETGTRLKGSYGTGFKAPVLLQLYDTQNGDGGNPNLKPETSKNWDAGLEQDVWGNKVTAGVTYFHNSISNLIHWVPLTVNTGENQNISRAKAQGVESFLELRPLTNLTLRGAYTHQQTRNLDTGSQLLRRPNDKASFDADYQFLEKAHLHFNVLVVGHKADIDPYGLNAKVGGYTILNLSGSYDIIPNVQVYGRLDNLLDKRYEEIYGYGTSGLAGYGGIKTSF